MQDKHVKSKETDITLVLVGIFVAMLAGLVIMLSNSFLETKTSSDSKAHKNTFKPIQTGVQQSGSYAPQAIQPLPDKTGEGGAYCRATQPLGLDGNAYYAGGDQCLAESKLTPVDKSDSKVKCTLSFVTGFTCQRNGDLSTIGNSRCMNKAGVSSAVCRLGLSCNTGETEYGACGLKNGGQIQQGTCCAIPPTPTPIPPAVPYVSGLMITDCTSKHINCASMFGYKDDGTLLKIQSGAQSPDPRNLKKDQTAFSKISCGMASSGSVTDKSVDLMKCVFPLVNTSEACDAYQFTYNGTCYVAARTESSGTYYNSATKSWENKRLCAINTASGSSWDKCKAASDSLSK